MIRRPIFGLFANVVCLRELSLRVDLSEAIVLRMAVTNTENCWRLPASVANENT